MFVFSFKADRKKVCVILAVVLLVVTAAIVLTRVHNTAPSAEAAGVRYSLSAATNEERVSFFNQFGWTVNAEAMETKDVTIPLEFNDVYSNYNEIQKEQGLDLTKYAGKVCKQWVYAVTNYPQETDVRGTILVYDNQVVGGDLSTVALDGFMTGFFGERSSNDTFTKSSALPSSSAVSSQAASSKAASSQAASSKSASSKSASSKSASSKSASSQSASSKSASSKSGASKAASSASIQEAKPKASSAIPTTAWPTD